MASYEDETYSTVFASLKHPIRRKILRILSSGPSSFSELQKTVEIESSHLTYHLEGLSDLLLKTEDGKYALSSLGKAAVSTMSRVEEVPKTLPPLPFLRRKWKVLATVMMVGLVLTSALVIVEYERSTQLSAQYSNISDLLQKFFPEVLDLRDALIMREYNANGIVETAYAFVKNETLENITVSSMTFSPRHFRAYSVYDLMDNVTLEIEVSINRPQDHLSLIVFRQLVKSSMGHIGSIVNTSDPLSFNANVAFVSPAFSYETISEMEVIGDATYSVTLPSRGWYFIQIQAPIEDAMSSREIGYTLTLRVRDQQDHLPFFIGSQQGSSLSSFGFPYFDGS
jgi:DNA-binding transcriptional ArsR family regulator